jgi:hypothetical protein
VLIASAIFVSVVILTVGVYAGARSLASAVRDHAVALAGYWSQPGLDELVPVDFDEVVAQYNMEQALRDGPIGEMVLESDLP